MEVGVGSFEGFVCLLLLIANDVLKDGNKQILSSKNCCNRQRGPQAIVVKSNIPEPAKKPNAAQYEKPSISQHEKPNISHHEKPNISHQEKPNTSHHEKPNTSHQEKKSNVPGPEVSPKSEAQLPLLVESPPPEELIQSTGTTTTITTYKVEKRPGQPDEVTKTVETITTPDTNDL
ncbi:hypothetical protein FO519_001055 [Halicephalobus sp. NKZ332]|nr:hypothetical protein FO519_001055 [Halicephalobus sp. NKZ332]